MVSGACLAVPDLDWPALIPWLRMVPSLNISMPSTDPLVSALTPRSISCDATASPGHILGMTDKSFSGLVNANYYDLGFSIDASHADLVAGSCTSCQVSQDKSSYWTPALYFQTAAGDFQLVDQVGGMLAYVISPLSFKALLFRLLSQSSSLAFLVT